MQRHIPFTLTQDSLRMTDQNVNYGTDPGSRDDVSNNLCHTNLDIQAKIVPETPALD